MDMIKGVISPDELKVNKGKLLIAGMAPILCTEIKGIAFEMEKANLPDATTVTGGRIKPGEFTIKVPAHHLVEVRLLEEWMKQAKDCVNSDYKKTATMMFFSASCTKFKAWNMTGVWCFKEVLPDAELKDEGNEAEIEFGFSYDDGNPVM
jgi:hypothetical protein